MQRRHFLKITIPAAVTGAAVAKTGVSKKDEGKPTLSFGVIADPQYADQPTRGSRYYRASVQKLEKAVEELNRQSLEFVVTLGDVIDKNLVSFKTMMPIYGKLDVPHRLVLGNHDFEVADQDKSKVLEAMGMRQPYYSEVRHGWRFIYLDGTDVSIFRYPKNDQRTMAAKAQWQELRRAKAPQARPWNGAIGEAQIAWFTKELAAAQASKQQVIVFCHYPVQPEGNSHNLWNAEVVTKLISKYPNVVAYMNGHNHKGNYAEHHGCHYINFKGMVETEDKSAYAVVHCYPDRLEIDGFETEPDRVLE